MLSRPALVEDVSNRDQFGSGPDRHDVQLTLELVDVDVAAAQMTHASVELERVAGVQHSSVVEAHHLAGLQSCLEASRRPVQ